MLNFDELVKRYDNAVLEAETKLPPVDKYPYQRIQIPIFLGENLHHDLLIKSIVPTREFLLKITFRKKIENGKFIGWEKE